MSTDVVVSFVTFSAQELALRLKQKWRFLEVGAGLVRIHNEPIADYEKKGGSVMLTPIASRELVRWVAWAIQEICPDAEADDQEADPSRIVEAPMTDEEAEKAAKGILAGKHSAIAMEADPSGGAHETVALVTYLVKRGLLELAGPMVPVVRALFPLLADVDDSVGGKLEDVLLDLDEVDELFAEADQLTKIVLSNDHIFDR